MKYLLDTNTCIFLMKNMESTVNNYKEKNHLGIAISAITAAELYFGVYNSVHRDKNMQNLANFLIGVEVQEFDDLAAAEYGRIRAYLQKRGELIGPLDMLIAAHAMAGNLTLVTDNIREFKRVEGLQLENWK